MINLEGGRFVVVVVFGIPQCREDPRERRSLGGDLAWLALFSEFDVPQIGPRNAIDGTGTDIEREVPIFVRLIRVTTELPCSLVVPIAPRI
jgi:hypothetical protein